MTGELVVCYVCSCLNSHNYIVKFIVLSTNSDTYPILEIRIDVLDAITK